MDPFHRVFQQYFGTLVLIYIYTRKEIFSQANCHKGSDTQTDRKLEAVFF